MGLKVEVFRDNVWYELQLRKSEKPKLNITSGSIKSPSSRKISHTNSLTIPSIETNTKALDLNIYNPDALSKRISSKYPSRISGDLGIVSEGYLVVNKIATAGIVVNIFPNDLSLIDQWDSNTLVEAFSGEPGFEAPDAFIDQIAELREFEITETDTRIQQTEEMSTGYPIAYFPNTLNKIGDNYSINDTGIREEDSINPFQTRPIFNCRALIELSSYAFGYTPSFSENVDLASMQEEFITGEGTSSYKDGTAVFTQKLPALTSLKSYSGNSETEFMLLGAEATGQILPAKTDYDWTDFTTLLGVDGYYRSYPTIFPFKGDGFVGEISFSMFLSGEYDSTNSKVIVAGAWTSSVDDMVQGVLIDTDPVIDEEKTGLFEFTVDKADFLTPTDGKDFIGFVMVVVNTTDSIGSNYGDFTQVEVYEEYTSESGGVYDDQEQYEVGIVNLMVELPQMTVKTFISTMLERYGLKMNIEDDTKTIYFYTYEDSLKLVSEGAWDDWSKYKIKTIERTTYLGEEYGSQNIFSLSNPLRGNEYTLQLKNQGVNSRYQVSAEMRLSTVNDVESIKYIPELVTFPSYRESTLKGIGLVRVRTGEVLDAPFQARYDELGPAMVGVPHVEKINFNSIPKGLKI